MILQPQERASTLVRQEWLIAALTLVTFAIRLYDLGRRTFYGDELGSVFDANELQHNPQAVSYFALLHFWQLLGADEFWLRALSVFFVTLSVPVLYAGARMLSNTRVALIACALLATSAFVETYAQQVRFYSLFLLAACLVIWAFAAYRQHPTRLRLVALVAANLLLLTTHVLASLFVVSELAAFILLSRRLSSKQKLLLFAIPIAGFLLLVSPLVRAAVFQPFAAFIGDTSTYSAPRGLTLVQFAKVPLAFFFFTFGESVYPLTYALVIPGAICVALAIWLGFTHLNSFPTLRVWTIVAAVISLGLLYLVFDSLIPSDFEGAGPRYIIFLVPLFYILLALGVSVSRRAWLVVPLLAINMLSLGSYWFGAWSPNEDNINWRAFTQWLAPFVTPDTVLLLDGGSSTTARSYFPAEWKRAQVTGETLPETSRLIVVTQNFHSEVRVPISARLQEIEAEYDERAAFSVYPLFAYVFDRRESPTATYHIDPESGRVNIPAEIYGLEFQDLRLPLVLNWGGHQLESDGSFRLPGLDGSTNRLLNFDVPTRADRITIFSNMTNANEVAHGTAVANLHLIRMDGSSKVIPVRAGFETNAWNQRCATTDCVTAFTWKKRLALLGEARYPESWQEFDASIFASAIPLEEVQTLKAITLERLPSQGDLFIWGISLK